MFDFLKGMGQMGKLLSNMPKIQEEMGKMRDRIAALTAEGDAGAGMVKAKVSGKLEVVGLTISEEAWKENDREMLETLIRSAVNQAISKVQQATAQETQTTMAALGVPGGMPPGMSLPGMG